METPPLERTLAAILAADVEGYSRLMHADEEATLATLTSHRELVDALIEQGNGKISGTAGDSVLAEFASVADAVTCAVAIQQALHKANVDLLPDRRMNFRIGINVGDVMIKDGDLFGDGVNVAARLEALAEAGGVCVTRGVRDHVRDRVPFEFEDLGEQAVKNIARPVRVFRVLFDPDDTVKLSPNLVPSLTNGSSETAMMAPGVAMVGSEAIELAFWQSVEASGTDCEYQAYLDKYPNGTFAALAVARRASPVAPAAESEPENHDVELAFWDSVKDSNNLEMLEAYLAKYPEGEFTSLAELKLRSLRQPR